jgi:hypothetical protein
VSAGSGQAWLLGWMAAQRAMLHQQAAGFSCDELGLLLGLWHSAVVCQLLVRAAGGPASTEACRGLQNSGFWLLRGL